MLTVVAGWFPIWFLFLGLVEQAFLAHHLIHTQAAFAAKVQDLAVKFLGNNMPGLCAAVVAFDRFYHNITGP